MYTPLTNVIAKQMFLTRDPRMQKFCGSWREHNPPLFMISEEELVKITQKTSFQPKLTYEYV